MKASKAAVLRDTWRKLNLPICLHKILSPEEDEGGHRTEHYVCDRCGGLFKVTPKERQNLACFLLILYV
jgi:hypothetical protein